jgi:hypothetical protein
MCELHIKKVNEKQLLIMANGFSLKSLILINETIVLSYVRCYYAIYVSCLVDLILIHYVLW